MKFSNSYQIRLILKIKWNKIKIKIILKKIYNINKRKINKKIKIILFNNLNIFKILKKSCLYLKLYYN